MKKKAKLKFVIKAILVIVALYFAILGYVIFTLNNNHNTITIGNYTLTAFNFKNATIMKYTGSKKNLRIPRRILYWEITDIYKDACRDNDIVETVYIPNTIKEIGQDAFRNCKSLREVYIEDGGELKKISGGTFRDCENLEELHLSEGITEIDSAAFCNDKMLYKLVIPVSVKMIMNHAFDGCYYLEDVQFYGDSFEQGVDKTAFDGTRWLLKSGDLVQIGSYLFMYKGLDDELNIPDGITGGATANFSATTIVYPSSYAFSSNELLLVDNTITIKFTDEEKHYFDNLIYEKSGAVQITVEATKGSTVWNDAIAHGLNVVEKTE